MADPDDKYASDTRSSEELLEAHRAELAAGGESWEPMAILHFRGGQTEFDIGKGLAVSSNAEDRAIGADLLGQLGWGKRTFLAESVEILIQLLGDSDPYVMYCAAVALGHRGDPRAVAPLAALAGHPDARVRYGVAFGIPCHDDELAAVTLMQLCRDSDFDTRNWAMFGLGTLNQMDSQAIRDALAEGLNDPDPEIRGEAILGLAKRHDPRVFDALRREWQGDEISRSSLEAAEELADPSLLSNLLEIKHGMDPPNGHPVTEQLNAAIAACRKHARAGGA